MRFTRLCICLTFQHYCFRKGLLLQLTRYHTSIGCLMYHTDYTRKRLDAHHKIVRQRHQAKGFIYTLPMSTHYPPPPPPYLLLLFPPSLPPSPLPIYYLMPPPTYWIKTSQYIPNDPTSVCWYRGQSIANHWEYLPTAVYGSLDQL